ncbi:MAG: zf-HC2 domain-containing protein [Acidobacteriota bacterium]
MCDSKELLVGYLYDELDAVERGTFETHIGNCAECHAEVAALRATRAQLTQWAPPDPDFAFTIVRRPTAPQPAPRFRISPVWGLAAAALLVMALGAAIAHPEVRYDNGSVVFSTGWNRQAPVQTTATAQTEAEWKAQVEGLNRRLRELESSAVSRQPAGASPVNADSDVLRQVRDLLSASEARQQRALSKVTADATQQRRADFAVINQSLTRLQNASDAEVRQYRDSLLRLGRVAYQQNSSQR